MFVMIAIAYDFCYNLYLRSTCKCIIRMQSQVAVGFAAPTAPATAGVRGGSTTSPETGGAETGITPGGRGGGATWRAGSHSTSIAPPSTRTWRSGRG